MRYGWLISGPGSTWVAHGFVLTRNFQEACVYDDPQKTLEELRICYPDCKWTLYTLTAEPVEDE